jgi:hypothetical protein
VEEVADDRGQRQVAALVFARDFDQFLLGTVALSSARLFATGRRLSPSREKAVAAAAAASRLYRQMDIVVAFRRV